MATLNTARLRNCAMHAERNLEWAQASAFWTLAAERVAATFAGALAKQDIDQMMRRAAMCRETFLRIEMREG